MSMSFAAHLLGGIVVGAGLPARLHGRFVLSQVLLVLGFAMAHVPDLLAASALR
jgi:hypothetical protein